jgi:hypothetical protein
VRLAPARRRACNPSDRQNLDISPPAIHSLRPQVPSPPVVQSSQFPRPSGPTAPVPARARSGQLRAIRVRSSWLTGRQLPRPATGPQPVSSPRSDAPEPYPRQPLLGGRLGPHDRRTCRPFPQLAGPVMRPPPHPRVRSGPIPTQARASAPGGLRALANKASGGEAQTTTMERRGNDRRRWRVMQEDAAKGGPWDLRLATSF